MQTLQIKCVNRGSNRLLNIGGTNSDGSPWKSSETKAIQGIKNGDYKFYVSENGNSVWVDIGTNMGDEYLKTVPDGYRLNNLQYLRECP